MDNIRNGRNFEEDFLVVEYCCCGVLFDSNSNIYFIHIRYGISIE